MILHWTKAEPDEEEEGDVEDEGKNQGENNKGYIDPQLRAGPDNGVAEEIDTDTKGLYAD